MRGDHGRLREKASRPPHRLQWKREPMGDATERGGQTAAGLDRAEQVIAGLAERYLAGIGENVATMHALLDRAEAEPASNVASLGEIFRIAHDIKGNGAMLGFPLLTKIGESLCLLLRQVDKAFEPHELDIVRLHVQAIEAVQTNRIKGDGGALGERLMGQLEALSGPMKQAS